MAGERIAHGEVFIEVNDREAIARLNEIRREYHNTMDSIDRETADPEIRLQLAKFEDGVANAKRELKILQGQKATVEVDADTTELDEKIDRAQAKVKRLDGQKAEVEIKVKGADKAVAEQERVEAATRKRVDAIDKLMRQQDQLADQMARKNTQRINREARVRESLNKQRLRELTTAEKQAYAMERERNEVPKLEAAYARLTDKLQKLGEAKRKAAGSDRAVFRIELDERATLAELENLRNEVRRRVGRDPIHLDIMPRLSERAGAQLRQDFLRSNGAFLPFVGAVGSSLGTRMGESLTAAFRRTTERGIRRSVADVGENIAGSLGRTALGGINKIGATLQGLSNMTVRLGPFTASIRQAVVAASLFAPIILDLVGALGSLVGVTGSAALGLGALGAAIGVGFLPAAIGMIGVIKPVVANFKEARSVAQAYQKALLEGNTDLAAKKLKAYHSVLKGVDSKTQETILSTTDLSKRFERATKPANASVFKVIGASLEVANKQLKPFTSRLNDFAAASGGGLSRLIRGLDFSAVYHSMDNVNHSIRPLLAGFGNLLNYVIRVGAAASHFLPGMSRSFRDWSKALLETTRGDNAGKFQAKIDKTVESLKALGRFLMASGRLLKTFFGAGVDSGQNFLDVMTKAITAWDQGFQTSQGKANLKQFFSEAVSGARAFWNTLGPIVSSFVRWAAEIAPIARGFFQGAAAISSFVAQLLRVTGLSSALAAVATTLGTLWAIGRITKATTAIAGFSRGLAGLSATSAASRATGGGGGWTAFVPAAGAIEKTAVQAERAAASGSRLARGLRAAGSATGGLITGLTGLSAGAGAAVLGIGALSLAIYRSATRTSDYTKATNSADKAQQGFRASAAALPAAFTDQAQAVLQARGAALDLKNAQKEVNKLQREGKTHTDDYTYAQLALQQAQQQQYITQQNVKTAAQQAMDLQTTATHKTQQEAKAAADAIKGLQDRNSDSGKAAEAIRNRMNKYGESLGTATDKVRALAKEQGGLFGSGGLHGVNDKEIDKAVAAFSRYQKAVKDVHEQQQLSQLATLNMTRAAQGLVPVAAQAAKYFADINRYSRSLGQKIAVKFTDPGDAAKVAASASKSLKAGVPNKVVTRIVADSSNATEAIQRLQRVRISDKTFKILQAGGKEALSILNDLVGKKLAPKVLKIISNSQDAAHKVAALIALGIPPKVARMLGDNKDALRKAAQANSQKLATLFQLISRVIQNPASLFTLGAAARLVQTVVRRVIGGGKASGGVGADSPAVTASTAARQDRIFRQLERGGISGRSTQSLQSGAKIQGPRAIYGEEPQYPEFVISTNPSYKRSNAKYLRQAAAQLGVGMFAAGRGDIINPSYGKGGVGEKGGDPTKLAAVQDYYKIQGTENDQNRKISIAESKVKEPDTLIKKAGADANGDPIYAVDEGAVKTYTNQLAQVRDLYAGLTDPKNGIMAQLKAAATTAFQALKGFVSARKANIDRLQKIRDHDKAVMGIKIPDVGSKLTGDKKKAAQDRQKKAKDRKAQAKVRWQEAKDMIKDQSGLITDAGTTRKDISDDQHDAGFRLQEYQISESDVTSTIAGVLGEAQSQVASSNPQNSPSSADQAISVADMNRALVDAGLGGGISAADAIGAQLTAQKAKLAEGQALLNDADPGNDLTGQGIVTAAASAIQGLNNDLGGLTSAASAVGAAVTSQSTLLSSARSDLFKNFGSNFALASVLGATGAAGGAAVGPNAVNQGTQVTVNNTFANVPPDPHTWSKGVQFELQAAL